MAEMTSITPADVKVPQRFFAGNPANKEAAKEEFEGWAGANTTSITTEVKTQEIWDNALNRQYREGYDFGSFGSEFKIKVIGPNGLWKILNNQQVLSSEIRALDLAGAKALAESIKDSAASATHSATVAGSAAEVAVAAQPLVEALQRLEAKLAAMEAEQRAMAAEQRAIAAKLDGQCCVVM